MCRCGLKKVGCERREKVEWRGEREREMGSCASVHKDLGFPKKLFLASSPTKEKKAANGKGGGGGVSVDLKRKEQQQAAAAGVGVRSPGSGRIR